MKDNTEQIQSGSARPSRSLADMVVEPEQVSLRAALSAAARIKIAALAVLFVLLNYWQFRPLVDSWLHDENWGHGFVIPLFSAYLFYRRFGELIAQPRRVCLGGLVVLLLGVAMTILGFYPIGTRWISQIGMSVVLFGLVLYLAGPGAAKLTWLPIFYLGFAMPIPKMLYTRVATPLQDIAAQSSALLLRLFGTRIDVVASRIEVVSRTGRMHTLNVIEACSGVRSLMAYVALGVAWAYLESRPIWQRIVLVLAAVPIALLCNVIRVAMTCGMFVIDRPELGKDFMHEFMGMAMLVPAAGMFWLLGVLLQKVLIEADDEDEEVEESDEDSEDAKEDGPADTAGAGPRDSSQRETPD